MPLFGLGGRQGGWNPVEFGRLLPDQTGKLRRAGNYFKLIGRPRDIPAVPKSHPATALAPGLLQMIDMYLHRLQTLQGIHPDVSLVVAFSQAVPGTSAVNASAIRTDGFLDWPHSYLVRIQIDCIPGLFDSLKYFVGDGQLLKVLGATGLPDLQRNQSRAELFNRGLFSALLFLFFHELAHVVRNHHACLDALSFEETSNTDSEVSSAGNRRIVETDADMIASISLAKMLPVICPTGDLDTATNAEYWYVWGLLSSFVLFATLAQASPVGDAEKHDFQRVYYSPLVRSHVLPASLGASLKLAPARSDDLLHRFYAALETARPEAPMLANYAAWQRTFDEDLAHWRHTERERVLWQSQGRFDALFAPDGE